MSLIVANNLKLAYGTREIFKDDSFQIGFKDRIGLIGPNGTGKTTLLRVIYGKQSVDTGNLRIQNGIRMGYLPQDVMEMPDNTLLNFVLESVPGKSDLETEIASCERELDQSNDPDEQMELAVRLSELHEEHDHQETFYSEHEAERILMGLGFKDSEFTRALSELSGGWKMRAALAGLLFQKPDLLLLDEPTNHLDALSVRWLDQFLAEFPHAILMICHDREFLDRHVTRVLSLEPEGLRSFPGNYTRYVELREEMVKVQEAESRNQEVKRKEIERFIVKYRANKPKARQAQSRIKLLRKMDEIKAFGKPQQLRKFSFPPVERTVQDVCLLRGIDKAFGDLVLYRKLSLAIHRGDRIAIIGINGIGKTTLLKIIAKDLFPDAGEVKIGSNVLMGYYAQHQTEQLNVDSNVLEEVWRIVPDKGQSFVRGVCGAFLFPGEDVDKKIAVLSGGEKSRVALARLLVKPYNFLLMDEPTNHLDLHSAEALAEALEEYEGTLVFVSHNQAFVNRLANKVWNVDNGKIEEFPGNLNDFYHHLQLIEDGRQETIKKPDKSATPARPVQPAQPVKKKAAVHLSKDERKEQRRQEVERRRDYGRKLSEAKKKIRGLEERITKLETKQEEISAQLADPEVYKDGQRMKKLLGKYELDKVKLNELMARWEFVTQELEKLEAEAPDLSE